MAGSLRTVSKVVPGRKLMEGGGVQVCRTLGSGIRNLDPFLMLDELRLPANQASAGFPTHPHRGFETCSIMLRGRMEHQDNYGNKGVIGPGGVQWMTAGRGVMHSEMPVSTEDGLWACQLWINMAAKDKMVKPRYQDYQADSIPEVVERGARVRVMAGSTHGVTGPVHMRNPGLLLDVQLEKGATFQAEVSSEWTAFAYISDGAGEVSGTPCSKEQALILSAGGRVEASSSAEGGLRFLLVAGRPIGEPIVQHGPFVMNTQEEIAEAFHDYQSGRLQRREDDVWAA